VFYRSSGADGTDSLRKVFPIQRSKGTSQVARSSTDGFSLETPHSLAGKNFTNLDPLTPGSEFVLQVSGSLGLGLTRTVHGYSLLRTQLNNQYFHDIFNEAEKFGVAIEAHRTPFPQSVTPRSLQLWRIDTETGPGVYETALAYSPVLRMADNAILFKFLAKSVGMKHGITPSFMAKPWGNVSSYDLTRHRNPSHGRSQLPGCSGLVDITSPQRSLTEER